MNTATPRPGRLEGRRIIVTGGAGFIGSHLCDACLDAGAERVVAVDNLYLGRRENLRDAESCPDRFCFVEQDASDLDAMRRLVRDEKPDILFSLAVIPLPVSLEQPRFCMEHNTAIAAAACELAREGAVPSLVAFSSSEVYGTAQTVPMDEHHPLLPRTPYAASKAAADHLVASYIETFGVDARIVRPFNNFGPRQNDRAYAGIIPVVIRRVLAGQPVEIHGDGEQTRDFIFARDTAEAAIDIALHPDARGRVLNVGSGRETSINELVRTLLDVLGRPDHEVRHVEPRIGDVRRHLAGISALRALTGFEPTTPLRRGLEETVAWYR